MAGAADEQDTTGAPAAGITARPIGYVRSAYAEPDDVPHAPMAWLADTSQIRLVGKHAAGLKGLEGYSHLVVLFWVHRARDWQMPRHHHKPPHVRVFATRMPVRPNPIGMSVVELLGFSAATGEVRVKGLDALDGTPVLDIKPYIPHFDSHPEAQVPDWVARHLDHHCDHGHGYREEAAGPDADGGPDAGRTGAGAGHALPVAKDRGRARPMNANGEQQ